MQRLKGKVSALKLTIDSTEPLEDALRVVGALYNVTLDVASSGGNSNGSARNTGSNGASRPARAAGTRARRRPASRTRRSQARPSTRANRKVSPAVVRSWARENGYAVADRGRVSAEVLNAYYDSQAV